MTPRGIDWRGEGASRSAGGGCGTISMCEWPEEGNGDAKDADAFFDVLCEYDCRNFIIGAGTGAGDPTAAVLFFCVGARRRRTPGWFRVLRTPSGESPDDSRLFGPFRSTHARRHAPSACSEVLAVGMLPRYSKKLATGGQVTTAATPTGSLMATRTHLSRSRSRPVRLNILTQNTHACGHAATDMRWVLVHMHIKALASRRREIEPPACPHTWR